MYTANTAAAVVQWRLVRVEILQLVSWCKGFDDTKEVFSNWRYLDVTKHCILQVLQLLTMQDFSLVLVVFLTQYLHTANGQWSEDVLVSGTTCEEKFHFSSCINSGKCMSNHFLECQCVPQDVMNVFSTPLNGALLCL